MGTKWKKKQNKNGKIQTRVITLKPAQIQKADQSPEDFENELLMETDEGTQYTYLFRRLLKHKALLSMIIINGNKFNPWISNRILKLLTVN